MITSAYNIRSLDNTYCARVIDLILPIQQIEHNVPVTLEAQPDLLDIERYYLQTGGHFWGAFHENELVGTIALISLGHNAGAIRKMFVKKEYRGKETGIAQQLLGILEEYCRNNGIGQLYLGTVEVLKAAYRFYERNGFERIAQEDLPAYFPAMGVDHIFFQKRLSS